MARSRWGWCFLFEPHVEAEDGAEVLDTEEMVDREGEWLRSIATLAAVAEALLEAAVEEADNALDLISATVTVGPCSKV